MKNRLFIFSSEFYTPEHDVYEYGMVAGPDLKTVRDGFLMAEVDWIDIGATDASGILLTATDTRTIAPRKKYTDVSVECVIYQPIPDADISGYEKQLVNLVGLTGDRPYRIYDYAKVPLQSEFGVPPAAENWVATVESDQIDGTKQVQFASFPEFDIQMVPTERTHLYRWTIQKELPKTIEHVLLDILAYVGRSNEYHSWAMQIRRLVYSETEVEGWGWLAEKVRDETKVWWRNPDWEKLVVEYVCKEASALTVHMDENGNPFTRQYKIPPTFGV